jgi:hypothetical protein
MQTSDEITIGFGLSKGEGEYPTLQKFSEAELADMRPCIDLTISWCSTDLEHPTDAKIVELEILYDGVSCFREMNAGYSITKKQFDGHPYPIVRFRLDQPILVEDFEHSIRASYWVETQLMKESGEGPFSAEDFNGYTEHIGEDNLKYWLFALQHVNLLNGRIYRFPEGLACDDGILLRTVDFIPHPLDLNATILVGKVKKLPKFKPTKAPRKSETPAQPPARPTPAKPARSAWSASLLEQTREAFESMQVNPLTGKLHLKHLDGSCGTIAAANLMNGHLHVLNSSINTVFVFPHADALIRHGWAID